MAGVGVGWGGLQAEGTHRDAQRPEQESMGKGEVMNRRFKWNEKIYRLIGLMPRIWRGTDN